MKLKFKAEAQDVVIFIIFAALKRKPLSNQADIA